MTIRTTPAGVPRWARIAAHAIPLTVLPSSLWRIAVCTFHAPIARGDLASNPMSSGRPGLPLAVYVILLSESLLFPVSIRRLATRRGDPDGHELAEAHLTDREAEVLRLVAQGRSNSEIAAELFLGVETVKTHVRNVLAKLGVRDRVQAVIAAYESGFIR